MRADFIVAILIVLGALALQLAPIRKVKDGDRSGEARLVGLARRVLRELLIWIGRDEPLRPNEVARGRSEGLGCHV